VVFGYCFLPGGDVFCRFTFKNLSIMLTMQLALNIDAKNFVQRLQINNQQLEAEVQKGLDKAFEELSKDGTIEKLIHEAVKKNIMDSFSRWVFQSDINKKIETQITEKLSSRINQYTDTLVDKIATEMNLPKD
jgi:hypothetical protein